MGKCETCKQEVSVCVRESLRTNKCFNCDGGEMSPKVPITYAYDVPGIVLVGVEESRCSLCGEIEVSIPRIESLHRLIAAEIIKKNGALTSDEIAFLQSYLELWDYMELAVGPARAATSRWSAADERILRLYAVIALLGGKQEWLVPMMKMGIADSERPVPTPISLRLKFEDGERGWFAEPPPPASVGAHSTPGAARQPWRCEACCLGGSVAFTPDNIELMAQEIERAHDAASIHCDHRCFIRCDLPVTSKD